MALEYKTDQYRFAQKSCETDFTRKINQIFANQPSQIDTLTSKLFQKLEKKEKQYGGQSEIDKLESIVSRFIGKILETIITQLDSEQNRHSYFLGLEKDIIKPSGQKRRPDYIIESKNQVGSLNESKPVFVIEAKRLIPHNQKHYYEKKNIHNLEDNLPQLFEYLRLLCLKF